MANLTWMAITLIVGMIVGARLMSCKYKDLILDAAETSKLEVEIARLYKKDREDTIKEFEEFVNVMIDENIMLRKKLKKTELGRNR